MYITVALTLKGTCGAPDNKTELSFSNVEKFTFDFFSQEQCLDFLLHSKQ